MNFLGHAFIARNHPHLIAGNFAGDSYKGNLSNFNHLPKEIIDGVKLHRFIDDFTDKHECINQVAYLFKSAGVKKVSFIACDILIDHHLSKYWKDYSDIRYENFIKFVYQHTDSKLINLPKDFVFKYNKLKEYGWMLDYPHEKGIENILKQFSLRIGFDNDLMICMTAYLKEKEKIDKHFKTFLNDIVNKSEYFILESFT